MRFVYKNIHWGAILTFYIIALTLRLITIVLGNMYPSHGVNYALELSTGLGPIVGALVAMAIFKRKTEYTITGKSAWKSIATILLMH